MESLAKLRTIAGRVGSTMARSWVGALAAGSTGLLCCAGWLVMKVAPSFLYHHLGGLRFAPHWRTVWIAVVVTAVVVWLLHAVARLWCVLATCSNRRAMLTLVSVVELIVACAATACLWVEARPREETFVISATPVNIHGEWYRALQIESASRHRVHRRPMVAWLERRVDTVTDRIRVRRGHSWLTRSGKYRLTLHHADVATLGAVIRHGRERVELLTSRPAYAAGETFVLHRIVNPGTESASATPQADVTIGNRRTLLPLDPEWDGETALLGLKEEPVFVLYAHESIGALLLAFGIGSFVAGVVLVLINTRLSARSAS